MMSLLLFAIFDSLLNIENHYFSREKFRCIAESGLAVRHSLRKWACIHFILFSMEIYYIFWKCWFHSFVIFYVHVCSNLNSVSKTGPESSHRYRTPKINAKSTLSSCSSSYCFGYWEKFSIPHFISQLS
jgi:hypothetical protein